MRRSIAGVGAMLLAAMLPACSSSRPTPPTPTTTSTTTTITATTTTAVPVVPGASLTGNVGAIALVADVGATGVPAIVSNPSSVTGGIGGTFVPSLDDAPYDQPSYYAAGCHATVDAVEPLALCVLGSLEGAVDVAVVGDSKMGQWMDALELIAAVEGWRLRLFLKTGCPVTDYMVLVRLPNTPARDYLECQAFAASTLRALTTPGQVPDLVLFSQGQSGSDGRNAVDPAMVDAIARMFRAVVEAGSSVVALADVPTPTAPAANVIACVREHFRDPAACRFVRNPGGGTPALTAAAAAVPAVKLVSVNDWVCPADECAAVIGGVLVYRQTTHLTRTYVQTLTPILHRLLIEQGVASGPEIPLAPAGSVGS